MYYERHTLTIIKAITVLINDVNIPAKLKFQESNVLNSGTEL